MLKTQSQPQDGEEYEINICRIGYGHGAIKVRAKDIHEAQKLALDQAGDHLYSEHHSEYELSNPVPRPVYLDLILDVSSEQLTTICAVKLSMDAGDVAQMREMQKHLQSLSATEIRRLQACDLLHFEGAEDHDVSNVIELSHQPGVLGVIGLFDEDGDFETSQVNVEDIERAIADGVKTLAVSSMDVRDLGHALGWDLPTSLKDGSFRLIGPYGVVDADEIFDGNAIDRDR